MKSHGGKFNTNSNGKLIVCYSRGTVFINHKSSECRKGKDKKWYNSCK